MKPKIAYYYNYCLNIAQETCCVIHHLSKVTCHFTLKSGLLRQVLLEGKVWCKVVGWTVSLDVRGPCFSKMAESHWQHIKHEWNAASRSLAVRGQKLSHYRFYFVVWIWLIVALLRSVTSASSLHMKPLIYWTVNSSLYDWYDIYHWCIGNMFLSHFVLWPDHL